MKTIKDASDLFPNCSRQFACGVHSYLNGEDIPQRPNDDDFIRGYYNAEEKDLRTKYKLKR